MANQELIAAYLKLSGRKRGFFGNRGVSKEVVKTENAIQKMLRRVKDGSEQALDTLLVGGLTTRQVIDTAGQ